MIERVALKTSASIRTEPEHYKNFAKSVDVVQTRLVNDYDGILSGLGMYETIYRWRDETELNVDYGIYVKEHVSAVVDAS